MQHFIFWNKVKSISFQYGGAMIILKNNKQFYINESDFLHLKNGKKPLKMKYFKKFMLKISLNPTYCS